MAAALDLAFVVDATASMGPWIEQVKSNIEKLVSKIVEEGFIVRIAFVAYRDWCDKDKRIQTYDFTQSLENFKAFVKNIVATGGGDTPEDVLGGLEAGIRLSWKSPVRIMYHIGDAPPHGRMYHEMDDSFPGKNPLDPHHNELFNSMALLKITYVIGKISNDIDKMIQIFKQDAQHFGLDLKVIEINSVRELFEIVLKSFKDHMRLIELFQTLENSLLDQKKLELEIVDINSRVQKTLNQAHTVKNEYDTIKKKVLNFINDTELNEKEIGDFIKLVSEMPLRIIANKSVLENLGQFFEIFHTMLTRTGVTAYSSMIEENKNIGEVLKEKNLTKLIQPLKKRNILKVSDLTMTEDYFRHLVKDLLQETGSFTFRERNEFRDLCKIKTQDDVDLTKKLQNLIIHETEYLIEYFENLYPVLQMGCYKLPIIQSQ